MVIKSRLFRFKWVDFPILRPASQLTDPLTTVAPMSSSKSTIGSPSLGAHDSKVKGNGVLDLVAILKASQAISSTLDLEELVRKLTQIVLQHSGGDRCVLILPDSTGDWRVRALATTETTELCSDSIEDAPNLPINLIRYVKNNQDVVVLDSFETELPVIDPYLRRQQPRSLLCLPIHNQGQLIGILYLSNQCVSGVFTEERIGILNLLCTQAAISLENARLYQRDRIYAEKLEKSLRTSRKVQDKLLKNKLDMQKQVSAIFELSNSKHVGFGHLTEAFQELTATTASTLKVDRVSIWLFNDDRTKIQCLDLFERASQCHSQGCELSVADHPEYFEAIATQPLIAVNDAQSDPRTSGFKEGYLVPLNIASMLDSNVQLDGETIGVICCEQVGPKRIWTQAEQTFARSVANLVMLTIDSNRRHQETQKLKQALSALEQTQLQLVQSAKMSALGNLVAGIAHEINNPLGFVNGNLVEARRSFNDITECLQCYRKTFPEPGEVIEEKLEELEIDFLLEDLPKLLDSMEFGCQRIRGISTSLRTFSRADTESQFKVNIHEGIDSTLLILKYRLKATDYRSEIKVVRDYGELPEINCFPGQLNQVFMNLLANAIDMFDEMAEGKEFVKLQAKPHQITIRTQRVDFLRVEIYISDNGKGMSKEVCSKIFKQQFTTKAVGKGTGLGLAIAHQVVVEKHGGSLEVQSELEQGTEFIIRLPIESQDANPG